MPTATLKHGKTFTIMFPDGGGVGRFEKGVPRPVSGGEAECLRGLTTTDGRGNTVAAFEVEDGEGAAGEADAGGAPAADATQPREVEHTDSPRAAEAPEGVVTLADGGTRAPE